MTRLPDKIPSQAEIKNILSKPSTVRFLGVRDKALLDLAYATGLRASELANIKLHDIDTSKSILKVVKGKNYKDRLVPIGSKSLLLLKKYIDKVRPVLEGNTNRFSLVAGRKDKSAIGTQHSAVSKNKLNAESCKLNALFLTRDGRPMRYDAIHHAIREYGEYAPHKYRHACATHLLQRGMREPFIQRLLGHKHLSTTQIYTRVTITDILESYEKYHTRDHWKDGYAPES